jgi:hypothetical protein
MCPASSALPALSGGVEEEGRSLRTFPAPLRIWNDGETPLTGRGFVSPVGEQGWRRTSQKDLPEKTSQVQRNPV